ncbi:sodium:calcium antiporter [Candidatus Magnetominusculus xianensis]|uniref:Ca2+/Na+ antiporter n=1 Tax=Candidatus Magnetominusculus xianensis TaxID=1748249 RepID=A0ABR5SII1_9BACT|nr:sodium:calcium antiporter [Candidatus Magnetominusculus xianensis]KWT92712.1 Ca2+/Na+ antiporter [Candidatus Magnetominusculus xianensis]MBF0403737.1 sodium:calcium antiporter [Nitrospirota bacterium]
MKQILGIAAVVALLASIFFFLRHVSHSHTPDELSYLVIVAVLILSMAIILGGCELFANGVENLGRHMNLSHAAAGGILAAVGTALPETLVPIFAIIFGSEQHGEGIAVGSILGAPFMLTTLAMFFLGVTVFILWLKKDREKPLFNVSIKALETDLVFYVPTMVFILIISLWGNTIVKYLGAIGLVIVYVAFCKVTLSHEAEAGEEYDGKLYLNCYLGCSKAFANIVLQILVGLLFIIAGAHIFIDYITIFSIKSGVSSLVLALIIAPLATELPEKYNSITWTVQGKDTLAMGNITGAMIFQSTIPISVGLLFTSWTLGNTELLNIVIAITMASLILITIKVKKTLPGWTLLIGGIFYAAYIVRIFS